MLNFGVNTLKKALLIVLSLVAVVSVCLGINSVVSSSSNTKFRELISVAGGSSGSIMPNGDFESGLEAESISNTIEQELTAYPESDYLVEQTAESEKTALTEKLLTFEVEDTGEAAEVPDQSESAGASGQSESAGASDQSESAGALDQSEAEETYYETEPQSREIVFTGGLTFKRNQNATISISAEPNTLYSITVFYKSGPSTAQGLEPKTSDGDGNVSWTWRIGGRTAPGTYRVRIEGDGECIDEYITVVVD